MPEITPPVVTPTEQALETKTLETAAALETKQPEIDSPYKAQLDELTKRAEEAENKLKEQETIIENKNRAIEASKKKIKEAATPEDELTERVMQRIGEKTVEEQVRTKARALTSDAAEQELIVQHYKSGIVKTGDFDRDFKNAIALTESDKIWEQRRNRAEEERREDFITSFSGSSLRGDTTTSKASDPIHVAAEQLLRNINPAAVEDLNKYFKK